MADYLPTFEVDKNGLGKLLARRGKAFVITELVQNAWDEDATQIDVALEWSEKPKGKATGLARVTVTDDDPEGFTDFTHAYTLFAESEKKDDAEKRGRFNLGEKLVIAVCAEAMISTTTGVAMFDGNGRQMLPAERERGSEFVGLIEMTAAEYAEVERVVETLLPPEGVVTTFNGEPLVARAAVRSFQEVVFTEFGPELRRTARKTAVTLYEPTADEKPHVYEMGIPVVEIDMPWHVDVSQKVPLNVDRDNVTPAWRRDLCRIVLNNAADLLDAETSAQPWVAEAMKDEEVDPQAVAVAIKARFGDKVVSYDPSDTEGTKIAVSQGYTVLSGGALPKEAWKIVRDSGLVKPAGQVTPSPKPYAPGAEAERKEEPREKWTPGMKRHAAFVKLLGHRLLDGAKIQVAFPNDAAAMNFTATFGGGAGYGKFEWNLRTLGRKWFERSPLDTKPLSLTIHEFGHYYSSDHLGHEYLDALTDLGARLTRLALDEPEWLNWAAAHPDPDEVLDHVGAVAAPVAS